MDKQNLSHITEDLKNYFNISKKSFKQVESINYSGSSRLYSPTEILSYLQNECESNGIGLVLPKTTPLDHDISKLISTIPVAIILSDTTIVYINAEGNCIHYTDKQQSAISLEIADKLLKKNNNILIVHFYPLMLTSESGNKHETKDADSNPKAFNYSKEFFKLIYVEKEILKPILAYSILTGILSLTLPIGIQTTLNLVSSGVLIDTVYWLIALVIIGTLLSGLLQIVQFTLLETLKQKLFSRISFDFAFRIPRIRGEALHNRYAPEMMNRFFEVVTIQKSFSKIFTEFLASALQIIFGLLLLSFYHPFFVFFSIFLIAVLFILFYTTASKGLKTNLSESKYKYKIVSWLEEVARTFNAIKLSGISSFTTSKLNELNNGYLFYRKSHFNILRFQYAAILIFKAFITGILLILGSILVVQREITLGQFVASEIIIITVINASEKIVQFLEVVYDMFTSLHKLNDIKSLPLENNDGITPDRNDFTQNFDLTLKNLTYKYPNSEKAGLKIKELHIQHGEKIAILGDHSSGKSTFLNIIGGFSTEFEGQYSINKVSVRELNINFLRTLIGENLHKEDIFEGTLLDNITLTNPDISYQDILETARQLEFDTYIHSLPDGLNTELLATGKGLPGTIIKKIILTRSIVDKPSLLLFDADFTTPLQKSDIKLFDYLLSKDKEWTVLAVSNSIHFASRCERLLVFEQGELITDARYGTPLFDEVLFKYAI